MRKFLLIFFIFCPGIVYSQNFKDTTFTNGKHSCKCQFVISGTPDVKPFDLNEKAAYFPGGEDAWDKFVKKNIDKKIKGKHEVEVQFNVEADGSLSNFRLINKAPNQKFEEVLSILKAGGNWFPAVQNGFCIRSVKRLMFEF